MMTKEEGLIYNAYVEWAKLPENIAFGFLHVNGSHIAAFAAFLSERQKSEIEILKGWADKAKISLSIGNYKEVERCLNNIIDK